MDRRRLGDSILKLRPSPFLLFLTPSVSTPRFFVAAGNPQGLVIFNLIRSRKGSFSRYRPVLKSSAAAVAPSSSPELDDVSQQEVGRLLHEVGIKEAFPTRVSSKVAAQEKKVNRPLSSLDAVQSAFPSFTRQPDYQPGTIHSQMQFPGEPQVGGLQNDPSLQQSRTAQWVKPKNIKPRAVRTIESSPSVGRTVELNPKRGVDLARALRKLRFECTSNNVVKDQLKQRYHERPGMKRKRLKRERWRVRFNQGFRAMVQKVLAMRRKGW